MNFKAFKGDGNWYKGNLHSHTNLTDGDLSKEESVKLYKDNGYSFLALSDHDIYSDFRDVLDTDDFITLPSIEYGVMLCTDEDTKTRLKMHHIHGILGTKEMQDNAENGLLEHLYKIPRVIFYENWNGQEIAQTMSDMLRSHGFFTSYNHPVWSRVTSEEFTDTQGISLIEVFNYNTDIESNTGHAEAYWDIMLRKGNKINAFASDDNHNRGMFSYHKTVMPDDSLGGWICVKAKSLTHEDIVTAIIAGEYYSSAGPEIYEWGVQDGVVNVKCSGVNRIAFAAGNVIHDGLTVLGTPFEDNLTQAQYKLKGHEIYIRVECIDKYGRTAWSNPIYFK